ncbi:tryptophan aminotransferase-related protein 1 [Selaginella moellendorffii]|uniref:tryptophan aminotransferase-related protein 1 n=1 Tax=Selaginella moellendorffii TaxID=88036 RepID=UPI000D1C611E|nr:tryptophan aminotransferase-related protein 1 [Selaginella moellendorffii]|eukprot:XP_024530924.1 tryptophan aminotransferase-related protein 1 [Selaginella moellendorffii]
MQDGGDQTISATAATTTTTTTAANGVHHHHHHQNHHQPHHHLLLASLGLNLLLLVFFAIDFKPLERKNAAKSSCYLNAFSPQSCPPSQISSAHDSITNKSSLSSSSSSSEQQQQQHLPVNLDHGDPTMFEAYWRANGDSCTTVILGWEQMSYFASRKHFLWFVEQELENEIRQLHSLVGNAVTDGRFIVVGTGSTQLFQAALYAVSPRDGAQPASVVSAVPYYSSYPVLTDYLKSGIHKWAGDAANFHLADSSSSSSYIELVTSPNNPDGSMKHAVVQGSGPVIYDLAYYWPHYTPITAAAEHDMMLFTVSKCTGHAGSRIGWAIVKDAQVAQNMAKFIELNTIGVSHDSQLRAAQILKSIVRGYNPTAVTSRPYESECQDHCVKSGRLFHFGYSEMSRRWDLLQQAVKVSDRFSLPEFSPAFCAFFGQVTSPHPAFAWLKCNRDSDCKEVLKLGGVLSRSGVQFGVGPDYVRISMLDREGNFETFIARLSDMAAASLASTAASYQEQML